MEMEGEMMLIYTKKKYTINAKNVDLPKKFSGTSATEKGVAYSTQKMHIFYRVLDVEGDPRSRRGPIKTHVWKILHIPHSRTLNKVRKRYERIYCCC